MNALFKSLPLAIAGFAIVLAGCASPFKPAIVTGTTIQNPSVGVKGYSLAIPPGFKAGETEKVGEDVPLWADVEASVFHGRMKEEKNIAFAESFFIYNPKIVIFFAASVAYARGGSLSMVGDRQANRFLLETTKANLKKDPLKTGTVELVSENKRRGVCVSGTYKQDQKEMSFQTYLIMGKVDEMFIIDGMSDPKDKEELASVTKQLYRDLNF